jgi:hypothetical protein
MVDLIFTLLVLGAAAVLVRAPDVRPGASVRDLMLVVRATGSLYTTLAFGRFCWRHSRATPAWLHRADRVRKLTERVGPSNGW